MGYGFTDPWVLAFLALAMLPLLAAPAPRLRYSWTALLPADPWAVALAWGARIAGAGAIAATVLGLAGLYREDDPVERIGTGAEIVILLDRSRSMDQSFARVREATDAQLAAPREPKAAMARRLLATFLAQRPEDRVAFMLFSTQPIPVTDFTREPALLQAAVAATGLGRGLSDTDLGRGVEAALEKFTGRPYTGSRAVLLVSDGGAQLDAGARERIARLAHTERAAIYWLYLRSRGSPGLLPDADMPPEAIEAVPEHFLHRFFAGLGVPYRAYEAENPDAVARAIADIGARENAPVRYVEAVPRRSREDACYAVALVLALSLLALRGITVQPWR